MPKPKPKKLGFGSALAKAARSQRVFYKKSLWDDSHLVGNNQLGDGRVKAARAITILGNTLTLGLWHIPAIGIGAVRNMHRRGRQRHRYNKQEAIQQRFDVTFGGMFLHQLKQIQADYEVSHSQAKQFANQLRYRLNIQDRPAGHPYGSDPYFLEAYAAFEADLRADPGVERLFQEWAPDA